MLLNEIPRPSAMTNAPKQHDEARQQRLRAALRENLKRRKSQARARSDVATAPDESGEPIDRTIDPRPASGKD